MKWEKYLKRVKEWVDKWKDRWKRAGTEQEVGDIYYEEKIKRYKFYLNQIMDKTQVTMSMLNFGGEN